MSQIAVTCASLCFRKASSTWSPRFPTPMKPRRTRSFAPSTLAGASVVASPAPAAIVNSRRVSLLIALSSLPPDFRRQLPHLPDQQLLRLRGEVADPACVETAALVAALLQHARRGQVAEDVVAVGRHPEPVRAQRLLQHR